MTGKIFVNYRREDEPGFAIALFGYLEQALSPEQLFMDVEGGIAPGQDFVHVIEEQVNVCEIMLVLIGSKWLTATDESGRLRLQDPQDFVRIEIDSAIRLGKQIVPVLLHKTQMPRADALPEPLKPLARLHAVRLTQERFKSDAQVLIKVLQGPPIEAETARKRESVARTGALPTALGNFPARTHASDVPPFEVKRFEELKEFAFSRSGLNMTMGQAKRWALEHANDVPPFEVKRFEELKKFAFSRSGLNMTMGQAKKWALAQMADTHGKPAPAKRSWRFAVIAALGVSFVIFYWALSPRLSGPPSRLTVVTVPAGAQNCVNTRINVTANELIGFSATGRATYGPEGAPLNDTPVTNADGNRFDSAGKDIGKKIDPGALLGTEPVGALIGKVNDEFFRIGASNRVRMPQKGALLLCYNDSYFPGNTGAYEVTIDRRADE
jgi:hypothetical protein